MKLAQIDRTATHCWSPFQNQDDGKSLICTGSVSGAMDATFSNVTDLEIFSIGGSAAKVVGKQSQPIPSRFNSMAWSGGQSEGRPLGVIVGGLEDGSVDLWNAAALLSGGGGGGGDPSSAAPQQQLIMRLQAHSGAVKALDFNPFQQNLLASGAHQGELCIWDLQHPEKPYSPSSSQQRARSDNTSCVQWSPKMAHILASGSSSSGACVVWDLKSRRELLQLQHSASPITSLAWSPETSTSLLTASDDQNAPCVCVWDLRNALAPVRTIVGHQKGILSLAWCAKDVSLLMTTGKDNRTVCWNPATGELLGELPQSRNWVFDVQWSPRNPDLVSTASFDGTISIYSLSQGGDAQQQHHEAASSVFKEDASADLFSASLQPGAGKTRAFQLQQAPKWMRPACGVCFAFGNRMLSFSNRTKNVFVNQVQAVPEVDGRIADMEQALQAGKVRELLAAKQQQATVPHEAAVWAVMALCVDENSRQRMVDSLGFGAEALRAKMSTLPRAERKSSLVVAVEQVQALHFDAKGGAGISDDGADAEHDDDLAGIQQLAIGGGGGGGDGANANTAPMQATARFDYHDYAPVAVDDAWTLHAIAGGHLEEAVQLCLLSAHLADALIIGALVGGHAYQTAVEARFATGAASNRHGTRAGDEDDGGKRTQLLQIVQSLSRGDLDALIQHAPLSAENWRAYVALVCTYGGTEEAASLFRVMGDRLLRAGLQEPAEQVFICAGDCERLQQLWVREFLGSSAATATAAAAKAIPPYLDPGQAARLCALMERVACMRHLCGQSAEPFGADAALVELLLQFCHMLTANGRIAIAYRYLSLVPAAKETLYKYKLWHALKDGVKSPGEPPAMPFQVKALKAPVAPAAPASPPQKALPKTSMPAAAAAYSQNGQYDAVPAAAPPPAAGSAYGNVAQVPANPYALPQPPAQGQYGQPPMPSAYGAQQPPSAYQVPQEAAMPYGAPQTGYGHPPQQQQLYGQQPAYGAAYGQQPLQQPLAPPAPSAPPPSQQKLPGFNDPPAGAFKTKTPKPFVPLPVTAPPPPSAQTAPAVAIGQQLQPNMYQQPQSSNGFPQQQQQQPPYQPQQQAPTNAYQQAQPQQPMAYGQGAGAYGGYQQQPVAPVPVGPPPTNVVAPQPTALSKKTASPPQSAGTYQNQQQLQQPIQQQQQQQPYAQPQQGFQQQQQQQPAYGSQQLQQQPYGQQQMPSQGPPAMRTTSMQQSPAAPSRHPVGDRSHISAEHMTIYETLSKALTQLKVSAAPAQKKQIDDVERRLSVLYDRLNNQEVAEGAVEMLLQFVKAVQIQDWSTCDALQKQLLTQHSKEGTNWILGLKRLVDVGGKLQQ